MINRRFIDRASCFAQEQPSRSNVGQANELLYLHLEMANMRVERIDIGTDGLNVRLRMDGLSGLAREMMADLGTAA